MNYFEKK